MAGSPNSCSMKEPSEDETSIVDDSMGDETFDDAMSVNEVMLPQDTESSKVNCPQMKENNVEESKPNPQLTIETLMKAHQAFVSALSGSS